MPKLIKATDIHTVNHIANYTAGKFRMVVKCRAGFMTVVDCRDFDNVAIMKNPAQAINSYKKGVLHTVEFCPEGLDFYVTVFAKKGKKIVFIDETILASLTVADINNGWENTNLYSQTQYKAVNAKTWADNAFVSNTHPEDAIYFLDINE